MDEVDNGAHDPVRTVVVGSTSSDEVPRPAEAKKLHANRLCLYRYGWLRVGGENDTDVNHSDL